MQSLTKLVSLRRKPTAPANHRELEQDLRAVISGDVRFDTAAQGLYATDASNYRHVPLGVVTPRSLEDLRLGLQICSRHDAPVLTRGGGTSLAGQCCNEAVVFDTSQYLSGIGPVDPNKRTVIAECGAILDRVREAAGKFDLTFGPDPSTHDRCTIGGMIGNNSCGVHAMQAEFYGPGPRTEDNLRAMRVLTYDGIELEVGPTSDADYVRILADGGRRAEIYRQLRELSERYALQIRERFPNIPRRVSGYNLPALLPENGFNVARALVGSEGTCVWVLDAELELIEAQAHRALLILGYDSVLSAGDHIMHVRNQKPIGLEGFDRTLVDHVKKKRGDIGALQRLPDGNGWLLVEFGGATPEEARERAEDARSALSGLSEPPQMKLTTDPDEQSEIWRVRKSALGVTAFVPGEPHAWPGWEDSAVPPEQLGSYLRALEGLMKKYGVSAALYGHFGQGCVHSRYTFELATAAGRDTFRRFTAEAADVCLAHGGSLSGEHGDGQARADLLPKMFGPELMQAFQEFKAIWDPRNRMNPGKIVHAHGRLEDLRLAGEQDRADPETEFAYPRDHGSFAHAALRCVGVGECRREGGGVMCPSYQVTRDEMHSTRGRAHLLFEMTKGEVVQDLWRSEEVAEALDLCLSCKGCKHDCPVSVDIATYKAEFLSHHYHWRLRPRQAYAFGLIMHWARLGSMVPRLTNWLTHQPAAARLFKWAAGVAPQRDIPRFSPRTFRAWWKQRNSTSTEVERPRVVLWVDTFNNHFFADTLIAAVKVLEAAGSEVVIPEAPLCCGRPLYDYGMLDYAREFLKTIVWELEAEIERDTPVVILEPSCLATFRDELSDLLAGDERAEKLSRQCRSLAEYLVEVDFQPPRATAQLMIQGHCHQHALLGFKAERELLDRMGAQVEWPNEGCCGMAGAFGFEKEKFEVSHAIAKQELLPALEAASEQTRVVADGFSCRQQIAQLTQRQPEHLAELIANHLHTESAPARPHSRPSMSQRAQVALLLLVAAIALVLAACVV